MRRVALIIIAFAFVLSMVPSTAMAWDTQRGANPTVLQGTATNPLSWQYSSDFSYGSIVETNATGYNLNATYQFAFAVVTPYGTDLTTDTSFSMYMADAFSTQERFIFREWNCALGRWQYLVNITSVSVTKSWIPNMCGGSYVMWVVSQNITGDWIADTLKIDQLVLITHSIDTVPQAAQATIPLMVLLFLWAALGAFSYVAKRNPLFMTLSALAMLGVAVITDWKSSLYLGIIATGIVVVQLGMSAGFFLDWKGD